jgi:hypothetical protein
MSELAKEILDFLASRSVVTSAKEEPCATAPSATDSAVAPAIGETSDGYHTFNELYQQRHALFAALCAADRLNSWKSLLHDDGTMLEGWFIAGIRTDNGQVTYHVPMELWAKFPANICQRAPKWDGHTPKDVVERLWALASRSVVTEPQRERRALMSNEYKAPCGCVIHVIQWYTKRKVVSTKWCALHSSAKDLLSACKTLLPEGWNDGVMDHMPGVKKARLAIAKAEGTLASLDRDEEGQF